MKPEDRIKAIETQLKAVFNPTALEIEDQSHEHAGHKSAGGAGHFKVTIQSDKLESLSLVQKHKAIYQALDGLMQNDIHALSIKV